MSTDTKPKTKNHPTLPLAPLWNLVKRMNDAPTDSATGAITAGFTATMFADAIGVSARNVSRWNDNGGNIPWVSADKAAIELGLHPMLVWGDDWLNVKGDYADIAAGKADADIERAFATMDAYLDSLADAEVDASVAAELDEVAAAI